jgi:hypothetical protein
MELESRSPILGVGGSKGRRRASGAGRRVKWAVLGAALRGERLAIRRRAHDRRHVDDHVDEDADRDQRAWRS